MSPLQHLITFPIKGKTVASFTHFVLSEQCLTFISQINIVVFASKPESEVPMGSVKIPTSQWAVPVPESEIFEEFSGWGDDVQIILRNLKNPLKWAIHMVNPKLASFVNARVALVGDAVSTINHYYRKCRLQKANELRLLRLMECYRTFVVSFLCFMPAKRVNS